MKLLEQPSRFFAFLIAFHLLLTINGNVAWEKEALRNIIRQLDKLGSVEKIREKMSFMAYTLSILTEKLCLKCFDNLTTDRFACLSLVLEDRIDMLKDRYCF